MKLSEFIAEAEKALAKYGDIPVLVPETGCGCCAGSILEHGSPEIETDVQVYDSKWNVDDVAIGFVLR